MFMFIFIFVNISFAKRKTPKTWALSQEGSAGCQPQVVFGCPVSGCSFIISINTFELFEIIA